MSGLGSSNAQTYNTNVCSTQPLAPPILTDLQSEQPQMGTAPGAAAAGRTHATRSANDPSHPGLGTLALGSRAWAPPLYVGGGRHHVPDGMHNDGMMAEQQHGAGTDGGGMPPTGASSQRHPGGGMASQAGGVTGSKELQAKALQMEQEAQGMKVQSQDLAQAERLEHEAYARRQRAVEHGAHPDNRHVGGAAPGDRARTIRCRTS
ncbi:hypothetical protein B0H13DRAFT_2480498 [Mycena leptocephala]|nr:hypothetical protein B0H13DRAFT_2480498 [Mycena leptocephala]